MKQPRPYESNWIQSKKQEDKRRTGRKNRIKNQSIHYNSRLPVWSTSLRGQRTHGRRISGHTACTMSKVSESERTTTRKQTYSKRLTITTDHLAHRKKLLWPATLRLSIGNKVFFPFRVQVNKCSTSMSDSNGDLATSWPLITRHFSPQPLVIARPVISVPGVKNKGQRGQKRTDERPFTRGHASGLLSVTGWLFIHSHRY